MTVIKEQRVVANLLQQGIKAIADKEGIDVKDVEEDLALLLGISIHTLKSWKAPGRIPSTIATESFFGLVWLILNRSDTDLNWFILLLQGTDSII